VATFEKKTRLTSVGESLSEKKRSRNVAKIERTFVLLITGTLSHAHAITESQQTYYYYYYYY